VRRIPLLAMALFAFSAPATGQQTNFRTFIRTYAGCAPGISCHTATVRWELWDHPQYGTVYNAYSVAESWFGHNQWGAGWVWGFITSAFPWPSYEGNTHESPPMPGGSSHLFAEPYKIHNFAASGYGSPTWVGIRLSYGLQPGEPGPGPYGMVVPLSVTPEPATLIMLGTGLAGIAAARRRRKHRSESETQP
jgi:hypothetical protein